MTEGYGRKTTLDYIRMLYISYGSVCELETQILLAWGLDLIEKGVLGKLKKYSRKRKNVKGADKVFRKQTLESLTLGILGPSSPTELEKNLISLFQTSFQRYCFSFLLCFSL
ncbi:MAG: four helix bundle protein [Deltaproteobacteria bacterium]|nr:four helix bundle protein [Deltaproteobacteria bacterium]